MGSVQFADEYGATLSAGIGVSITPGPITGTTDSTGSISATLDSGTLYTATFSGSGAPSETPEFWGNTQTGRYLTDDSGDILTTDGGADLLVSDPTTPTIVEIAGYALSASLRLAQIGIEWARALGAPNARLAQLGIEWAQKINRSNLRLAQIGIEWAQPLLPPALRLAQIGFEWVTPVVRALVVVPANATTTTTGSIQYHAHLYANGGFVGEVEATWSLEGGVGSIDPSTGLFSGGSAGSGTVTATSDD